MKNAARRTPPKWIGFALFLRRTPPPRTTGFGDFFGAGEGGAAMQEGLPVAGSGTVFRQQVGRHSGPDFFQRGHQLRLVHRLHVGLLRRDRPLAHQFRQRGVQ